MKTKTKQTKKRQGKVTSFLKKPLTIITLFTLLLTLPIAILSANNKATQQSIAQVAATCQKIILPAYFYPSSPYTLWEQSISGSPTLSVMIVNPASGPGTAIDSNYTHVIARLRESGIKPIGYITSSYASRTQAQMQAEVDAWKSMYGITEIFIDEATSDAGHIPYYAEINNYIKSKTPDAMVVINPGTTVDEGYMDVADVITIFEGSYSTYLSFQFPSWIHNYPANKFLHLIYDVQTVPDMQNTILRAQNYNAGYVYVTDDLLTPGHPWDTIPPYWADQINTLQTSCVTATPTDVLAPTSTPTPTVILLPTPTSTPQGNVIQNGTFNTTLTPWYFTVNTGASGTITLNKNRILDNTNAAKVSVTRTSSNPWDIQLGQNNIQLAGERTYTLTFWAKASKPRPLSVSVQKGVTPYTYYLNRSVSLTTFWKRYRLQFTQQQSESNALSTFNFAQAKGNVWIDNVTLK